MNRGAMPLSLRSARALPTCLAASLLFACSQGPAQPALADAPLQGAAIGGEFALSDSEGETVRWSDFDDQWRIIYFGYAYCPDICPTDVQRMTQGLNIFAQEEPELARQIQPIFVTIDPERDTPEVVGEFTRAFSDRMIGLTGTPEQIAEAADEFGVYYSRGEETGDGAYLVDHTNVTYLFDPAGDPIAMLPTDQGAEAVAAELAKWVR